MVALKRSYYNFSRRCQFAFNLDERRPLHFLVIGLFGCLGLVFGTIKGWLIGGAGGVLVIAPILSFLGCCVGALINLLLKNLAGILLVLLGLFAYLLSLYLFFLLWGLGN